MCVCMCIYCDVIVVCVICSVFVFLAVFYLSVVFVHSDLMRVFIAFRVFFWWCVRFALCVCNVWRGIDRVVERSASEGTYVWIALDGTNRCDEVNKIKLRRAVSRIVDSGSQPCSAPAIKNTTQPSSDHTVSHSVSLSVYLRFARLIGQSIATSLSRSAQLHIFKYDATAQLISFDKLAKTSTKRADKCKAV